MQLPARSGCQVRRIAILDCERNVPTIAKAYGPYFSGIFTSVLADAAKRLDVSCPLDLCGFDVVKGHFPDPRKIDAILVTGSMAGAYDPDPWIKPLADFIKLVYSRYPEVRIAGVCFGHQIISQTLLGGHGVIVEKHPGGFESGLQTVMLNPKLTPYFPGLEYYINADTVSVGSGPEPQLCLQFGHGDHVVLPKAPGSLPGRWMSLGSTKHCHVQGLFEPGRVLTSQPHWECDSWIMSESFRYLFTPERGYRPDEVEGWVEGTKGKHDSLAMQEWVLQFLLDMLPSGDAMVQEH